METDDLIASLREYSQSLAAYNDPEFCYDMTDAADALESLQAQLAQVTRERDAAVTDLAGNCVYCKRYGADVTQSPCRECIIADASTKWEWRGVQEEKHED